MVGNILLQRAYLRLFVGVCVVRAVPLVAALLPCAHKVQPHPTLCNGCCRNDSKKKGPRWCVRVSNDTAAGATIHGCAATSVRTDGSICSSEGLLGRRDEVDADDGRNGRLWWLCAAPCRNMIAGGNDDDSNWQGYWDHEAGGTRERPTFSRFARVWKNTESSLPHRGHCSNLPRERNSVGSLAMSGEINASVSMSCTIRLM